MSIYQNSDETSTSECMINDTTLLINWIYDYYIKQTTFHYVTCSVVSFFNYSAPMLDKIFLE